MASPRHDFALSGGRLLATCLVAYISTPSATWAGASAPGGARAVCHDSASFRVTTRDRADAVGSDIVVRPMKTGRSDLPCTIEAGDGSFQLEKDGAAYFLAVADRFLALDAGTGPDRDLLIYDLATRKKLVDAPYDSDRFKTEPDAFVYWRVGAQIREGACLMRYRRRHGLPRQVIGHDLREVRFSFGDGVARETGRTDCTVTQDDMG